MLHFSEYKFLYFLVLKSKQFLILNHQKKILCSKSYRCDSIYSKASARASLKIKWSLTHILTIFRFVEKVCYIMIKYFEQHFLLLAYSLVDRGGYYCQGSAFIVGLLLMQVGYISIKVENLKIILVFSMDFGCFSPT